MSREVMQQALEDFTRIRHHFDTDEYAWEVADNAVAYLRQAIEDSKLEKLADEPVAMQMDVIVVNLVREGINKHRARELAEHFIKHTTPQPHREFVGLTDEEIDQGLLRSDYALQTAHAWRAGVVFAMTQLKEKNT